MPRKQYFGIKYPFTNNGAENFDLDLNQSEMDKVTSDILHLIFTPKGQRLRMPDYGTDLIKYIFEPDDSITWAGVKREISQSVSDWVKGASIDDIQVLANGDGTQIFVRVDYSVVSGNTTRRNSIAVEL